ncbi:PTI1-like tyrosine-protein kinase At3g15890 [Linum grandiflorum]
MGLLRRRPRAFDRLSPPPRHPTHHTPRRESQQRSPRLKLPSSSSRFRFCKVHTRRRNARDHKSERHPRLPSSGVIMLGKASESCNVYSFGILLLELCSGKKPLEKVNATVKRTIIEWALPLACSKRFDEVADPRLNGKFDEVEMKRVVLVALVCTQTKPEKRPTMM